MTRQKVLILGNKNYYNFKLDNIIDSFDVIYRCNLARPGENNGTKFGKLAMCGHVYQNFVLKPLSKEQAVDLYKTDYIDTFVSDWYDFFQENKENFDEIFHQDEHNWGEWNRMLEEYGSPNRFSKMATTGYSTIFRNLAEGDNKVYVSGFKKIYEAEQSIYYDEAHYDTIYRDEIKILNWLHNNKKVDASLCMLEDVEEPTLKTNVCNTEPSEFILDLLNKG